MFKGPDEHDIFARTRLFLSARRMDLRISAAFERVLDLLKRKVLAFFRYTRSSESILGQLRLYYYSMNN